MNITEPEQITMEEFKKYSSLYYANNLMKHGVSDDKAIKIALQMTHKLSQRKTA